MSDDEVLDRLVDFLNGREGLRAWTLAEAGGAIGLSPAGLLKRFGSRNGLLAALSTRWVAGIPGSPRRPEDPEGELAAWVASKAELEDGRRVPLVTRLSQLVGDLADPVLAALLVEGWRRERAYVAALLTAHDLARLPDPDLAAALLLDALTGAGLRSGAGDGAQAEPQQIFETLMEAWK